MAPRAARKWKNSDSASKRQRNNDPNEERLKILRLDLHTITAQIKMLEGELAIDPCLSTDGMATVLSLVDTLKQELEGIRLRIRELKESPEAQST